MTYFEVVEAGTGKVLSDLPSPRLVSVGGGLAWSPDGGKFWRVREDSDPEGTTYTRVTVRHLEDWTVDFHVKVAYKGEDDEVTTDEYDDSFPVKAASNVDALNRATAAAYADIEDRFGTYDDGVQSVSLVHTHIRKGFRL